MENPRDPNATPVPALLGIGVLVVDDEEAVRQMLEVGLKYFGFKVWMAGHGEDAVEIYQKHQDAIGVVLLDVQMDGKDGPATLRLLHAINPDLPCCFMTGHMGSYTLQQLQAQGAGHVLCKPFALDEAARVLRNLATRGKKTSSFMPAPMAN